MNCSALVPYGVTKQSYANTVTWARRKAGLLPSRRARRKPAHCKRGHTFRAGSFYLDARGRHCKACAAIRRGRKLWKAHVVQALIAAHPDHGGSRTALTKALTIYRQAVA